MAPFRAINTHFGNPQNPAVRPEPMPPPSALDPSALSPDPSPATAQLWEYQLEELSLYFLLYTEGANLRHLPEGLWFLFWVFRNSSTRMSEVRRLMRHRPPGLRPHGRPTQSLAALQTVAGVQTVARVQSPEWSCVRQPFMIATTAA